MKIRYFLIIILLIGSATYYLGLEQGMLTGEKTGDGPKRYGEPLTPEQALTVESIYPKNQGTAVRILNNATIGYGKRQISIEDPETGESYGCGLLGEVESGETVECTTEIPYPEAGEERTIIVKYGGDILTEYVCAPDSNGEGC